MLASDRQLLLCDLKQDVTALKQKEFNLHHENYMTVGTQAAVLAGLDIVMLVEFSPPPDSEFQGIEMLARALRFTYYVTVVAAFCSNIIVVAHTTVLSVFGGSLALRGPDGSMLVATDGMFEERNQVFKPFQAGLALTVISTCVGVWLILNWEAAIVGGSVAGFTCWRITKAYRRVQARFHFKQEDTVDFQDILQGPANIMFVPSQRHKRNRKNNIYLEQKNSFKSDEDDSGYSDDKKVEFQVRGLKHRISADRLSKQWRIPFW